MQNFRCNTVRTSREYKKIWPSIKIYKPRKRDRLIIGTKLFREASEFSLSHGFLIHYDKRGIWESELEDFMELSYPWESPLVKSISTTCSSLKNLRGSYSLQSLLVVPSNVSNDEEAKRFYQLVREKINS